MTGGIMPVSYVNNRVLGMGLRPDPLASRLRELYWRRHEGGWDATPVKYDDGADSQTDLVQR